MASASASSASGRAHRRLKLHCVEADLSLQDFLTRALREKLDREARRHRKGHA